MILAGSFAKFKKCGAVAGEIGEKCKLAPAIVSPNPLRPTVVNSVVASSGRQGWFASHSSKEHEMVIWKIGGR